MARQKIYLTMEDFKDANVLNVTFENGWVVVWLENCRIKFRNWKAENEQHTAAIARTVSV